MELESFVRALPKTELHLHLEGAVAVTTVVDLALKHGIQLPDFSDAAEIFDFPDLPAFLKVYDIICRSIIDADDFHRVTYEAVKRCADNNTRYVELFFSPAAHFASGVAYATMLDGILAGMRDAERDRGTVARLIPAHNRELGVDKGLAFLDMVLADRRDGVIGIGLDYDEVPHPPAPYRPMYDKARAAGLHVTAHAGENGPARNVRDSIALLRVERIDHGYHTVEDPALMEECRASGIGFTCCPTTTLFTTPWRDLASPHHAIRRMIEAGLTVTINTDDAGLFRTDLNAEYLAVARNMGIAPARLAELALNGIRISWLDATTKAQWLTAWRAEIDGLLAGAEA